MNQMTASRHRRLGTSEANQFCSPYSDMDVQQLFKNLRKEAECPLCLETVYDPKTLPCLHSFCLHCLDKLATFARRQLQETIKCPVCLTLFKIPEEDTFRGFPTSFHLNRLVDILALKDGKTKDQRCDSCEENSTVTSYCFICQSFLCTACLEAHQRLKTTRGHRNVLIEKLQVQDVKELIQRPVMCTEKYHQNEALEYFCQDCEVCICMKCGFVNHNSHTMVDIQQAAEERKIQITEVIDKAKEQVAVVERKMNRQIEVMKKTTHEMLTAGNEITATVDELVRDLREQETAMKTRLGQINDAQQRDHATHLENFQLSVSRLNLFVECGEGVLQRNIASEILQAEQNVTSRFEELLSASEKEIYRPRHFSYIPNEDTKQVIKVSGPGQVVASFTDPSRSVAEWKGPEAVLKSGKETNFTVITRDSNGNQFYNEDDQVIVRIRSPAGEVEENKIEGSKDGSYNVRYKPKCVGQHEMEMEVNGIPLNDSPWKIQVIPATQHELYKPVSSEFLGHGKFRFPCSMAQSEKTGNIAVADYDNKKVLLFDSGLKYLRTVVDLAPKRKPRSLAFTKFHNILVVDETSAKSSKISVFTENGELVKHIGEHLSNPCSVSVGSDGNIIVCNSGDASVRVLSPDGTKLLRSFKTKSYDSFPWCAVYHEGKYFVSDRMGHCVKVFNEEGEPLYDIGQFNRPAGLAIDKFNQLFVCDFVAANRSRVRFFTLDGKLVGKFLEDLNSCFCSVAVTHNGYVLVSDVEKGSIQVFQQASNAK